MEKRQMDYTIGDETALDHFIARPPECALHAVREMDGPIVILGAGGKMGLHLAMMLRKALEAKGMANPVIAVSRFSDERTRKRFADEGIETLAADLCQPEALANLPDASQVFFFAGIKFGSSQKPELLHQMNVAMPRLVAQRYRHSRIVALSTGCVYPYVSVESGGATEETPPDPLGAYAESCLQREQAFEALSRSHGTPVALIRLNYAVEPRYGVLVDIACKVRDSEPIPLEMGHFNCIWQGDALGHIIAALDFAATPARPLNVTGPEILRTRDVAEAFGQCFGLEPHLEGTEAPTAWLNDAGLACERYGKPAISVEQSIQHVAEWQKAGGRLLGKPTRFEVRNGQY